MSIRRLQARIASSLFIDKCVLKDYALAFHKSSEKDGSGKCDIIVRENSLVYGALFEISESDLPILDGYEGAGYDRTMIQVARMSGEMVTAHVYIANVTDPDIQPYSWYKHHVIEGAKELALPSSYIASIQAVKAIPDKDVARSTLELSIYDTIDVEAKS